MSFASAIEIAEAHTAAQIVAQTWGHMDAEPGSKHQGSFVFINGQHGDVVVVSSEFPTFDEGPAYFEDRQEYLIDLTKDEGPCSEVGVYHFTGFYQRLKNGSTKLVGKVYKVDLNLPR